MPTLDGKKRKAADQPKQEVSEDETEEPDADRTAEIKDLEVCYLLSFFVCSFYNDA